MSAWVRDEVFHSLLFWITVTPKKNSVYPWIQQKKRCDLTWMVLRPILCPLYVCSFIAGADLERPTRIERAFPIVHNVTSKTDFKGV